MLFEKGIFHLLNSRAFIFPCVASHDNTNPEWFFRFSTFWFKKREYFQFEGDFCENPILIAVAGQAINYARSMLETKEGMEADLCVEVVWDKGEKIEVGEW